MKSSLISKEDELLDVRTRLIDSESNLGNANFKLSIALDRMKSLEYNFDEKSKELEKAELAIEEINLGSILSQQFSILFCKPIVDTRIHKHTLTDRNESMRKCTHKSKHALTRGQTCVVSIPIHARGGDCIFHLYGNAWKRLGQLRSNFIPFHH